MAECPDGRTNRGTRSQFRIGLPSFGLSKEFYPVNLGKIMDAGQSSQISSSSTSSCSRDLISPCKGTHTLTVREYEQTIDELKKENFNLKLRLYLCEENHKKPCSDKDSATPNDEMVQVIVHLSSDAESLRAELKNKEELLKDALEHIEKLESDCKELEKINGNLQSELTSFSELPSREDISLLLEEKKNFVNDVQSLQNIIKEKEEDIDTLNQKIEILANENTRLEEKVKKRSLAIQGFVYKSYKEKEMLPAELKNIVISAAQAAKKKNKDGVAVAVKSFTSALNNIMSASDQCLNRSKEKENVGSPTTKCLTAEILEKSTDSFLASQTVSPSRIAQIQDLKEVFSERNIHDNEQTKSLDSYVHHSYIRGKMVHQNAVNISDQGVINFCDISPSTEENLISFSQRPSLQTFSANEVNLIDKDIMSPTFHKLMPEKDTSASDQVETLLKENEQLKHDLEEKLSVIKDLHAVYDELKGEHLQKIGSDALKASQQCCVSTQTKIGGNYMLEEYEIGKLEKEARLSDNIEELRENVLLLLLAVEEKDKELSEVKQTLVIVQEDLKKALNTTSLLDKEFYMHERNELHERLASSCSINEKLMKHLKSLEKFMEDLLQHKLDNSLESLTDKSDFMSSLSKCLNESLNLSRILSDNLSICEGSKLFEECESFAHKNSSYSDERILPSLSLDRLSMPEQSSYFGSHTLGEYISYAQKSNVRVGKESDSSQLCWRCWQQLNPSLNQSELSHLMQNNHILKPVGYQSSDSDIWSEPDRNVSMQRIGISLQNSPVSSKSPRKLRQKDKRLSSRISSKEDTSSSEYLQASKKRQGSASRRLFPRTQDSVLDKFYFLVSEKSSRLKSLLVELESVDDGKLSKEGWVSIHMIVLTVEDARQKLHSARENAKVSPVCEKCVMLELFYNIKASYKETDFFIEGASSEEKILQEFSKELCLLKEACKEPFSLLNETVSKKSKASQSDFVVESEQITKLETIINDLTNKNNESNDKVEEIKQMLSKEKEELVSVKAENSKLLNNIDNLKIDLIDMRYKEKELSLKNENLAKELISTSKINSELDASLKNLELKKKESAIALDQLTAEFEKKKSDFNRINEKCLEFEKHLNEQIHIRENTENKLKNLESESLKEKNYYLCELEDLHAEKNHYIQELKTVQEKTFALEKENAVVNDRLESKNNQLLSLKGTLEKLQNMKETQRDIENGIDSAEKVVLESVKTENFRLLNEKNCLKEELLDMKYKEKELSFENKKLIEELDHVSKNYSELNNTLKELKQKNKESSSTTEQLKAELQKNESDLSYLNKKCSEYEKQLDEQIKIKQKYESQLKTLESKSSGEKENYLNQLDALNAEKNLRQQELENIQEKVLLIEKENEVINSSLHSTNNELSSLKKLLSESRESTESAEVEKFKLLNQVNQLEEELSHMKNKVNQLEKELSCMKSKEKEFCLKNEKLNEELTCLSKDNSELKNALCEIEEKRKESTIELNQLTAEFQKNKSDLIHMTENCMEYEKQLKEQIQIKERSENQLKKLESESLCEKSYHLCKIDDLNAEKDQYVQELKAVQDKRLVLEKENAVINDRLQSKNNELLSLKGTMEKLQSIKETENDIEYESETKEKIIFESINAKNSRLLNEVNCLKELLDLKYKEKELSLENKKYIEELDHVSKNNSELNNTLNDLKQKNKEYQSATEQLKAELQKNKSDLFYMNKKCSEYETKLDEQIQVTEKYESTLKTLESRSLSDKENYQNQLDSLSAERNHYEQELENVKTQNLNLSNQVNEVEEELSHMKSKEKELCLENKRLIEKFNEVSKSSSELSNTLKSLEQKRRESNFEVDHLTAELEKCRSDVIHWSEKCLAYEKQLVEQNQMKEKYENELKNERKDYLIRINKLNTEKDHYLQKLESVQEKKVYLEKEISAVYDTLQSKDSELLSLQKTIEALREKQLDDQTQIKEKYENYLKNERKDYLSRINKLNTEKDLYLQKLDSAQEKELHLEKEIRAVNDSLQSKNNEFLSLQKTVEELQKTNKTLNSNYEELHHQLLNNREYLTNLQEKCKTCEEVITKLKEVELGYCQQLKQLKAKSTSDKEKLLNEISVLKKEKDDVLLKLRDEKEYYKKLKAENVELKENYSRSSHQVTTLKQRNDFFENALLSSNKECDILNKDLKCLRNTLQDLESKCLMYEKRLAATAGMKDNLTECLLNINNEFSTQRQKLNEMTKIYGNDDSVVWDETSFTKFIPAIDEHNVSKICESIVSETKKLSQSVDMLLSILKSHHLKYIDTENSEEKNQIGTQSLKKQIEYYKTEIESLRVQNNHLQYIIDELQNSVSEKEKSIDCNTYQVKTLEEKLKNSQKEIDRKNELNQRKDDEITRLQERIFNLQIYVNSIITDKKNMLEKSTSMTIGKLENSISSSNQLPSKAVSTDTKMCQTDECESITHGIDESFSSVSSLESGKNRCCEKYWKKCYSLQTKLAVCQKRIEILEKDKDDLKERLLQQLQNKRDSGEKTDSAVSKLIELESKLEKKKLFICELKNELLKTCNSLIDKEKEVDDLKQKLAECQAKFRHETFDTSKVHPIAPMTSVDTNVNTLKTHKWELIQTIFDIQRKFYEKKGIHLNYFDRFKEHVNNLYSLQLIPPLSKSESMPLLRSHALNKQYKQGNEKVKKLADLELEIECLENLKIFLNRFLVPCVFPTQDTFDKQTEIKQKTASSDQLSSPVKIESRKEFKHEITDILKLSFPEAFITADNEMDLSIDVIASTISQHLDCIKIFLDAITKKNWLKIMDLSVEDSVAKSEVKSLLTKIFQEINVLHKGANKLFNFNAHLRSFDFVTTLQDRLSMIKLDASDRESIMSEETIAVSRTESPLSFEDTCPTKLPHSETLQLDKSSLKNGSVGNRVTVIEPYTSKITVVDGSCDSVCQRSHYSSPDLGIESDPNHESSAPEHKEDGTSKYQMFPFKLQPSRTSFMEFSGRWPGPKFGETFYAIGTLPHFELLKQEIKESLVAIKSILSRTGDGLHHIAKYTSPRKTLEYNTLKSIKDTCVHMEVCLKEANNLVGKFWTAPCPTEKEWKMLTDENQKLSEDLACLRTLVEKQENEFKTAMGKLEHAQAVKDNMEKKISKKLVKTKKLIRQAELKLLETRCQNFPPVPKYPSEQTQQADAQ